jgi:PIN domain nuclease of toxin-antitoxin system
VTYLVDTHVWLWILGEPARLGPAARELVGDTATHCLLSAVSVAEIAIKYSIGRLTLPAPPDHLVGEAIRGAGAEELALEHRHALAVATLPLHHRDPFDRLLVAQAQVEGVPIITVDRALEPYDVEVIWAA